MRLRIALVSIVSFSTLAASMAADWPGWRGPNRDGYSADKGLATKWESGGPKLLYKLTRAEDIGSGYGSPAVVGDKMYIIGAEGTKKDAKEFVTCLSLKDGKQFWRTKLPGTAGDYNDGWGGGPRSTPTVDGDTLYVLGATGDLAAIGTAKGDLKWKKNLVKDLSGKVPTWGYSESVLIDGDDLVCTPGSGGGVLKLNKKTGATVWQCKEVKGAAGYSSIVIGTFGGVKQYVQQNMTQGFGIDAKSGKLLWDVSAIMRRTAVIPTPVIHEDMVFFPTGYGVGCECYKIEGTKATKLFSSKVIDNKIGGVIQVGGKLYGNSYTEGKWVCVDMKSGEKLWDNPGVGNGSVSYADGYLYCYSENKGELARVKATDKGYEEAGRFTIPEKSSIRPNQGKVWAHPVIANGKLILRDYEKLFVYDVSGPGS